ncbi:MAG: 1-acyl-sn-glycerol-3-phosphate acyltransferase [Verrucomicrobia bacterium]|nr:1-acyl-sn-glycerol-3-phosphate acyltransferase [Verrucomicrobiota bacterium]
MSDRFYKGFVGAAKPIFRWLTNALVLGRERVPRHGAFVLASTHSGFLDVVCVGAETPRVIRWLTLAEITTTPVVGYFIRAMGVIPICRGGANLSPLKGAKRVLMSGGVIGIFPEGELRPLDKSVVKGGPIKPGAIRLAHHCRVPVLPVVLVGSVRFNSPRAFLPFARTRFGIWFGELVPPGNGRGAEEISRMTEELRRAFALGYQTLMEHPDYK